MSKLPFVRTVPWGHVALAGVQLALSGIAVAVDVAKLCSGCEVRGIWGVENLHLWIALAGSLAYLSLVLLGVFDRAKLFYFGVMSAAGVHTVLAAWIWTQSLACFPCIASAVVAAILAAAALGSRRAPWHLVERAYVPVLLASACFSYLAIAEAASIEETRERGIEAFRQEIEAGPAGRGTAERGRTVVRVFESDECPYCAEFRDAYLPRLRRDFGDAVEVRFADARSTNWVRRTPTIALENGLVFEGLPERYGDLQGAVSQALEGSKGASIRSSR